MTLTDLKRKLQPGVTLRNTARAFKPELIGSIVTVKKNTALGAQFERDGATFYFEWPKASRVHGDDNGFVVYSDDSKVVIGYEFLAPPIS